MAPDRATAREYAYLPRIRRIGRVARTILNDGSRGRIAALFERCLYVETAPGALCCIGREAIGNGPLNALVDDWYGPRKADCRWDVGNDFSVDEGVLFFDRCPAFQLHGETVWRPRVPQGEWSPATLLYGLAILSPLAASRAPREGLGAAVNHVLPEKTASRNPVISSVMSVAWPSLSALADWLDGMFGTADGNREIPREAARLIGLGPGLTPSGDDFLGGMLIALTALGEEEARKVLAEWLMPAAAVRTGSISIAHIASACEGEGAEAIHTCLDVLLGGDERRFGTALNGIDALGHSSGWDALAGMVFVLTLWLRSLGSADVVIAAKPPSRTVKIVMPSRTRDKPSRSSGTSWRDVPKSGEKRDAD